MGLRAGVAGATNNTVFMGASFLLQLGRTRYSFPLSILSYFSVEREKNLSKKTGPSDRAARWEGAIATEARRPFRLHLGCSRRNRELRAGCRPVFPRRGTSRGGPLPGRRAPGLSGEPRQRGRRPPGQADRAHPDNSAAPTGFRRDPCPPGSRPAGLLQCTRPSTSHTCGSAWMYCAGMSMRSCTRSPDDQRRSTIR